MCPKLHLGLWVHPPSFTALQWGGCGCECHSADVPVALRAFLPSSSANKTHACHLRQRQPWLPLPSHPITFIVEFRLTVVQEWFPVMCLSGRYKNEGQFLLSFSHTILSRSGCGFSFVFVFLFVLFWFFECKRPNKPFPFYQVKLSFPSEAFCLQWMENEALFLRLNLGHTSERVCTGCPLASEQAGSPRCPDGSPDSPACLTLGIC